MDTAVCALFAKSWPSEERGVPITVDIQGVDGVWRTERMVAPGFSTSQGIRFRIRDLAAQPDLGLPGVRVHEARR
jgi:hypothetical protein